VFLVFFIAFFDIKNKVKRQLLHVCKK